MPDSKKKFIQLEQGYGLELMVYKNPFESGSIIQRAAIVKREELKTSGGVEYFVTTTMGPEMTVHYYHLKASRVTQRALDAAFMDLLENEDDLVQQARTRLTYHLSKQENTNGTPE